MRAPAVLLLCLAASAAPALGGTAPQAHGPTEGCTVCHGKERVQLARGVHARTGLTCVTCHGGVPEAIETETAHAGDFRSLADPRAVVSTCGDCHSDVERMRVTGLRTDQLALYRTSRHGSVLFETGNPDVATCADCHGSHEIRRAEDPSSAVHPRNQAATCGVCHGDAALMERYGLPADVPELYARSVHGVAVAEGRLASPACSDCHGHHGALPPKVGEAEQVCGQCHSIVQEHFEKSPHFRAEPPVLCVTCHGNHAVRKPTPEALVGAGPGACSTCHGGAADPARGVGAGLHEDLVHFERRIQETAAAARRAGDRGLYLQRELGFLEDARGVLVRARALAHSTSREDLDDLLNRGMGMVGQTEDSLETLRRVGRDRSIFTAVFFVLTVALAIMLLMYAREIRGVRNDVVRDPRKRPGDER